MWCGVMWLAVLLPGVGFPPEAEYTEHSLIGYRWYDYHAVTPAYCFGHGLSFTSFSYGNISSSPTSTEGVGQTVECEVTNTGSMKGSEVVQLYLTSPTATATNGESQRQLKHFVKLSDMAVGESRRVAFELSARDLSSWEEVAEDWRVNKGEYTAFVATSSCDFRQSITFEVV